MTRIIGIVLLLAAPTLAQTTHYVDCTQSSCPGSGTPGDPFCRIQDAIAVAMDGDTVVVAACTYAENLDFLGKAINLVSASGKEATIIDGGQNGPVATFQNGEPPSTILDGFTLTNGSACNGGGILCLSSSPTIRNSTITRNTANGSGQCGNGGGVYLSPGSAATFQNSTIDGNLGHYGGGLCAYNSSFTMTGSTIASNRAVIGAGVYLTLSGKRSVIDDSTITRNEALMYGGGVQVTGTPLTIVSSTISRNSAQQTGGGLGVYYGAKLDLVNSEVVSNSTSGKGGGMYSMALIPGQKIHIVNTTFAMNTASNGGGAIESPTIFGIFGSDFEIVSSIFWLDSQPELSFAPGTVFSIQHSNLQGGAPGSGNLDLNPEFRSPSTGDFSLSPSSPCIDSGNPAVPPGMPRWDRSGRDDRVLGRIDMGADEYGHAWSLSGTPGSGGSPIHFEASSAAALANDPALVLLSLGSAEPGIVLPRSGGRRIGLTADSLFNVWSGLPTFLHTVTLQGGTASMTAPFVIPPYAPAGLQVQYAGFAWSQTTGKVRSVSATQSFVIQ